MPKADPLELLQRRVRFALMVVILLLLVWRSFPELEQLATGHIVHPARVLTRVAAIALIVAILFAARHRPAPKPEPARLKA